MDTLPPPSCLRLFLVWPCALSLHCFFPPPPHCTFPPALPTCLSTHFGKASSHPSDLLSLHPHLAIPFISTSKTFLLSIVVESFSCMSPSYLSGSSPCTLPCLVNYYFLPTIPSHALGELLFVQDKGQDRLGSSCILCSSGALMHSQQHV